jgi:hypothetical protein
MIRFLDWGRNDSSLGAIRRHSMHDEGLPVRRTRLQRGCRFNLLAKTGFC